MGLRVRDEIISGLVCVPMNHVYVHPLGAMSKGDNDFRSIVDCSTPMGLCINEHTGQCRTKLNSVIILSELLLICYRRGTIWPLWTYLMRVVEL